MKGRFGHHRLAGRGQLLEALGKVHRVAHQGVLKAFLRTEQGRRRLAGGEPHAQAEGGQAFGLPSGVDPELLLVHRTRCGHGPIGMVLLGEGSPEDSHHGVSDELHHGATLSEDRGLMAARCTLS